MTMRNDAIQAYTSTINGQSMEAIQARNRSTAYLNEAVPVWLSLMGMPGIEFKVVEETAAWVYDSDGNVTCHLNRTFQVEDLRFVATAIGTEVRVRLFGSSEVITSLKQGKMLYEAQDGSL